MWRSLQQLAGPSLGDSPLAKLETLHGTRSLLVQGVVVGVLRGAQAVVTQVRL